MLSKNIKILKIAMSSVENFVMWANSVPDQSLYRVRKKKLGSSVVLHVITDVAEDMSQTSLVSTCED